MDEIKRSLFSRFLINRMASPLEKRRAQFLSVFALAVLGLTVFLTLLNLVQWILSPSREFLFYVFGDLIGVAAIALVWFLNRSGYMRWAAVLFLTILILSISLAFPISDLDKVFVLYALPTVAASFILPPTSSIYFALFSIVGYSAAYFMSGTQTPYNYISAPTLFLMAFASWMISSRLEDALTSAQESEAKLLAMVEQNPAVVYIAEPGADGKWEYVSPQIERLLGFSVIEWLEHVDLWTKQIHPDDQEHVLLMENRCKQNGESLHVEYRISARDGREVWVSDDAVQLQSPGQPQRMLGLMLDISDRKRAEKIRDAIYRISQAVYAASNLDHLYDSIHEILGELMPVDNFYIALYDPENDLISFAYFVDEYDEKPQPRKLGRGLTEYVLRSGSPQFVSPDRFLDIEIMGEAETVGAPSLDWLGVPLKIKDRTIGVMAVQTYTEGVRFGKQELDILTFVSTQVAMVIDRKKTEDTLWESEERYRRLFEDALLGIFQLTAEGKIIAINPAYAHIFGYASIEDMLLSIKNIATDLYWDGNNRPEILGDVLAGSGPVNAEVQYRRKDGSPFTGDLHVWGVWAADGSFQYLEGFVEDITDRKEAEQFLTRQNAYLETLNETALAMLNRLDANDVLQSIVQRATQLFGVPDGFLCLTSQGVQSAGLDIKVGVGLFSNYIGLHIEVGEGVSGRVLKSGEPLMVEDYFGWEGRSAKIEPTFYTMVAVPLKSGLEVTGVLGLARTQAGHPFDTEQVEWINRLAQLASIALDNARLFTAAQRELEVRQQVEGELRESNQLNSEVISGANAGIIVCDNQLRYMIWNPFMERLTNIPASSVLGKSAQDVYLPMGVDHLFERALAGETVSIPDIQYITADRVNWASGFYGPHCSASGEVTGVIGVIHDITERKEADEQIKAALREKEVLLREVHHRVKNNLQVISSLLSLQADGIQDPQTHQMFNETQSRVRSMALVHEGLYQSKDLARINFSEYIQKLTSSLFHAFGINPNVDLHIEIEDIYLGVDTAIPCGLIINELASNALKYAFPARKRGTVLIKLVADAQEGSVSGTTGSDIYTLTVSDNGIGFPKDLDFDATDTLGMQLVNILTKQLNGSIRMEREAGTTFTIRFTERKIRNTGRLIMADKADAAQKQRQGQG
ncbi:MAG: PAS domain S-box protein [Anaerolineaceae bacterium]|nr:PAS domain S-box protein [Anaerolineaceae bacterium]